jgi:beta-galactosidase GanA
MSSGIKGIPYGSTYYPLTFDEDNWKRDLALMAQADMNIVRLGDVGTWDRVEAVEGHIELDGLKRFYSLANQYGINILLSTGTASPPLWLANKYPDVRILSSRGERYPLGASYHWACVHHPGYLEACQKYIHALAQFAGQQPNHYGWQIANEIGFPFNPTREVHDIDLYCYCENSKRGFIEWLKTKYGSVEKLTEAWAWGATNYRYLAWEDAFPPEALPKTWSSVTRWIDWRLFWQQAFTDHIGWQHQEIRKYDQDHPTSVNTFNFKGFDRFGTYTGLDQWNFAKQVDHIGYDLYPGSGNKLATRPEHNSIFLDHGRSVSRSTGSDFWLPEIESGPIGGWLLGPDRNTGAQDIHMLCFESIGHDGKLLVYMPWKEWEFLPLHWGAIVDLQGNPTPRYEVAAVVGRYIKENAAFLSEARVPQGEVAILESKSNAIFLRGTGQEEYLFDAQRGAYRSFWDQDYAVDFITPGQLKLESIQEYQVICMPLMGMLSLDSISSLQGYVKSGGVLIAFARSGTVDERGWLHTRLPTTALGEIFGLEKIEADTLDGQQIIFKDQTYTATINRDVLFPSNGTQVLGEFSDGHPAITLSEFGNGLGVYVATQADAGALHEEPKLLPDLIETLAEQKGFNKRISIDYPGKRWRAIDPHFLDTAERSEVILISYLDKKTHLTLHLTEAHRQVEQVLCGMIEKSDIAFSRTEQGVSLVFDMPSNEVECIQIRWMGT